MEHFKVGNSCVPLLPKFDVGVTLNQGIDWCEQGGLCFHHNDRLVFEETTTLLEIGLVNLNLPFVSVSVFITFEQLFKAVVRVVLTAKFWVGK